MIQLSHIALAALAAPGLLASVTALAQPPDSSVPVTRAQVRANLVEWRQAGYDLFDWLKYPDSAQRTAAILAQRRDDVGAVAAPSR
jgi:hypothetical protein